MIKIKYLPVVLLITLAFLLLSIFNYKKCYAKININPTAQAEYDAQKDISKAKWFMAGLFGSVVGLVISTQSTPDIPEARFTGKAEDYIDEYKIAYVREMKSLQTKYSAYGCGAESVGTGRVGFLRLTPASTVARELF